MLPRSSGTDPQSRGPLSTRNPLDQFPNQSAIYPRLPTRHTYACACPQVECPPHFGLFERGEEKLLVQSFDEDSMIQVQPIHLTLFQPQLVSFLATCCQVAVFIWYPPHRWASGIWRLSGLAEDVSNNDPYMGRQYRSHGSTYTSRLVRKVPSPVFDWEVDDVRGDGSCQRRPGE